MRKSLILKEKFSADYVENPRVGGSIPPQATSLHAPQRPIRVLGRFYISSPFSTIR